MTTRYSNVGEVPLALAVFLASDYYDYNSDPYTISTTTLLKPLRQIILPTRMDDLDQSINLADMMNSRMGTAIHDGIERAWLDNRDVALKALGYPQQVIDRIRLNPEPHELSEDCIPIYVEQRLEKDVGKWKVTGKFDFVGEGKVQDFKSTSVFTYKNQTNAAKYVLQGSIYRWLNPELITQDEMEIHYIFTDWKPSMVRTDPNYPPRRFMTQRFNLQSIAETEAFVRRKLQLIEQYMNASEEQIPNCTDEDLWRSEPVYKYYKNPANAVPGKRSTKNFDTKQGAYIRLAEDGNVGIVKEVPGQVTACKYCPAFAICSQKDVLIANGDLLLE